MTQDEKPVAERVYELEKLCAKQSGQIEAVVNVLSDLLAAHVVLRKDVRLLKFIDQYLTNDREKFEAGGTERTKAAFFEARFDGWAEILNQVWQSQVFDNYWFRSLFFRREERQRDGLDKTQAVVRAILDKHGL